MDVGGYPLNLAYNSGVGMDQEASWVGLGWDLSVGQINRNVRGIPDDFMGDEMNYKNNIKDNVTVGANFNIQPGFFGFEIPTGDLQLNLGLSLNYNSYSGFSATQSIGVNADLGSNSSIGFNVSSSQDGLSISPNLSLHSNVKAKESRLNSLGSSVGTSFNSRKGIEAVSLSMTRKTVDKNDKDKVVDYSSVGSSYSYVDNTYTPSIRQEMNTRSFTVNAALGSTVFGGEAEGSLTAYGTIQSLAASEKDKTLYAYGYEHTDIAPKQNTILDYNREKDGNFSVNSTNLPITNYTHDIYSVKGEGVSGVYRAHRNQVGYVFDSEVQDLSMEGTGGIEVDGGSLVKFGTDVEGTSTTSRSGMMGGPVSDQQLNLTNPAVGTFTEKTSGNQLDYEKIEFRNMGDLSADHEIGVLTGVLNGYNAIRLAINGSPFNRYVSRKYENANTSIGLPENIKRNGRYLRNQAILNISVEELKNGIGDGPVAKNGLQISDRAKNHHTGEVQITRNDGARYIYGLPAYNQIKKETTFAVKYSNGDCSTGLVLYDPGIDNSVNNKINDKYFNQVTTPGYAHTYLLTSILSTDYQDIDNDGPTTNDLGSYTKFTYVKKSSNYKWRVPFEENQATYNEGLKTDIEDDRGNYTYGVKELHYVKTIETKTHIAVFNYSTRQDAKGVLNENGGLDPDQSCYKLDSVALYALPEFQTHGISATPIKTVHFEYNYDLCQNIPNNLPGKTNELSNAGGKLTLKKVYFTYRDSKMGKYSGYSFDYGDVDNKQVNPDYHVRGFDSWGNYKPNNGGCGVTDDVTTPEFNFTEQTDNTNSYAQAWSLQKINLPSGGVISMKYESDDYAYVQNKKALRMFKVVGAGDNPTPSVNSDLTSFLFKKNITKDPNTHLYVEVDPNYASNGQDFYNNYIKPMERTSFITDDNTPSQKLLMYFRFFVNMTKSGAVDVHGNTTDENHLQNTKYDYVSGYVEIDTDGTFDISNIGGKTYASISVKLVEKEGGFNGNASVNPISKAGWQFGRKYLSKDVYSSNPNGAPEPNQNAITDIAQQLVSPGLINNLFEIFEGPNGRLQNDYIAQRFVKEKSWIRILEPSGIKKGGGVRVKEIIMSDIWEDMTGNLNVQTMNYGQEYTYRLENGTSSGVATYEPVGNKENPFVMPVLSTVKHMLAPSEDNYIEKPFGESFFPSPQITYSRVKVSNRKAGVNNNLNYKIKDLNKTGHIVTEFYTSKDYPTIVDQTPINTIEDKTNMAMSLLNVNMKKHFTASQGYMIHTNDMNGKERSKRVFAQGQDDYISGVDYRYKGFTSNDPNDPFTFEAHNVGKLDNNVKVIMPDGSILNKTLGVEYDVVNDFRENESETRTMGINLNANGFLIGLIPGIVPSAFPDFSASSDNFKSVVTTKVIHTFGILQETIAHDAGASVYTRNLAWDGLTGEVLVTETVDEYNDKYYSFNYPAHWYYDGMGAATKNLGLKGVLQNTGSGYQIQSVAPYISSNFLVNGDEIWVDNGGVHQRAWVVDLTGNTFRLIDKDGVSLSLSSTIPFRIIRSGRRNLQSAGISNVTLLRNPLKALDGSDLISLKGAYMVSNDIDDWKIIDAGAVDYSDFWKPQCECGVNIYAGIYNPYTINEKGVWRTKSSHTYLAGRNNSNSPTPRVEGFYTSFSPFYKNTNGGNWVKDPAGWTFTQQVTEFSPYGFELENKDALDRFSGAQYGYNHTLPMAVGANSRYTEMGYDGFEDYDFEGCNENHHFSFKNAVGNEVSDEHSHTGKYSTRIEGGSSVTLSKTISCKETDY